MLNVNDLAWCEYIYWFQKFEIMPELYFRDFQNDTRVPYLVLLQEIVLPPFTHLEVNVEEIFKPLGMPLGASLE